MDKLAERWRHKTYRSPAFLGRVSVVFLLRSSLERSQVSLPPPSSRRRRSSVAGAATWCRTPLPSCLLAATTLLRILEHGALRQHVLWPEWLQTAAEQNHERLRTEDSIGSSSDSSTLSAPVSRFWEPCLPLVMGFFPGSYTTRKVFQQKLLFCLSFIRNSVSRKISVDHEEGF